MTYIRPRKKKKTQLSLDPKRLMISSSSFFQRNQQTNALILVYNTLKNDLFYMVKITLQNDVNFPNLSDDSSDRESFRRIGIKSLNIDLESSRLLHCINKCLYYT